LYEARSEQYRVAAERVQKTREMTEEVGKKKKRRWTLLAWVI